MYKYLKKSNKKRLYLIGEGKKNRTSQKFVGEGDRLRQKQDDLTEMLLPEVGSIKDRRM